MTHQDIKKQSASVFQHLAHKELKDAFDVLQRTINKNHLITYHNTLENLQTTYKYMLQYTVDSANDPAREQVYNKLFVDTYELADNVEHALLSQYSSKFPYSKQRTSTYAKLQDDIKLFTDIRAQYNTALEAGQSSMPFDMRSNYQQKLGKLFNSLCETHFYDEGFINFAKLLSRDSEFTETERSNMTSAISLSLWRNFDQHKFDALFEIANSTSELIRQRAYVGIIIGVYIYSDRIPVFANIKSRFNLLADDVKFVRAIENIIIQFIRTKESEKIARRFSEEIIPEVVKLSPQMRDKLNFTKSDSEIDGDEDKNPDWKDIIDEVPGLTDKMKEISEMQMEGADVFLSTFSMLKIFPFFNQMHNWLMPFDPDYPEIVDETKDEANKSFIDTIAGSRFLCNSDKYSFVLSMQQMPTSQKELMAGAMGADFEGMKEIEKDETSLNKNKKAEYISNQYIQDLYRLFNLHPQKNDFDNIFEEHLDFHNKNIIAQFVEDKQIWRNIAEYYFAKNYFEEASELYDTLLQHDAANAEVMQKRGYCAQKLQQYDVALEFYLKADLVESNHSWTIKKIAYCYRALEQADKALEYYQQAIALQPKNVALQLSAGHCQLSLNKYEEALNTYFKIELESKKGKKAWRPIAWSSFISNKVEQAQRYYEKIIADEPTAHDYINAGHTYLVMQDNKKALELYNLAITALNNDINAFLTIFDEDKHYLLSYNIDKYDLPILLDKVRYDMESFH